MTRETKFGLLVGLGVILMVSLVVSDHLSVINHQQSADFTGYAEQATPLSEQSESFLPQTLERQVVNSPAASEMSDDDQPWRATPSHAALNHAASNSSQAVMMDSYEAEANVYAAGSSDAIPTPEQLNALNRPQITQEALNEDVLIDDPTLTQQFMDSARDIAATTNLLPMAARVDSSGLDPRDLSNSNRSAIAPAIVEPDTEAPTGAATLSEPIPSPNQNASLTGVQSQDPVNAQVNDAVDTLEAGVVYTVKPYDTLYDLAVRFYGSGSHWPFLQKQNADVVRANGQLVEGTKLFIPKKPASTTTGTTIATTQTITASTVATIEVKPGDSLSRLAARHLGDANAWPQLLEANRDVLKSANLVRPGMKLKLPATANSNTTATRSVSEPTKQIKPRTYTIKSGDTLAAIAKRLLNDRSRWDDIYELNKSQIKNPNVLQVGVEIRLPS